MTFSFSSPLKGDFLFFWLFQKLDFLHQLFGSLGRFSGKILFTSIDAYLHLGRRNSKNKYSIFCLYKPNGNTELIEFIFRKLYCFLWLDFVRIQKSVYIKSYIPSFLQKFYKLLVIPTLYFLFSISIQWQIIFFCIFDFILFGGLSKPNRTGRIFHIYSKKPINFFIRKVRSLNLMRMRSTRRGILNYFLRSE